MPNNNKIQLTLEFNVPPEGLKDLSHDQVVKLLKDEINEASQHWTQQMKKHPYAIDENKLRLLQTLDWLLFPVG